MPHQPGNHTQHQAATGKVRHNRGVVIRHRRGRGAAPVHGTAGGKLRTWPEDSRIRFVLVVSCDHRVPAGGGRALRADQLAARLPKQA